MATQCPSCGRNLEDGQTVCACGQRAEVPVSKSNVIAVVLVGAFLVVLILGGMAALGVIAWRQFTKSSGPIPQTVTADSSPSAAPASRAMTPVPSTASAFPLPQDNLPAPISPATSAPAPTIVLDARDTQEHQLFPDISIKMLRSPIRKTRDAAAASLHAIGWQPTNDEERALLLVAMDDPLAAERYGEAAVDALCLPLQDGGDFYLSQTAAECLGRILDIRAVGPLSKTLRQSKDSEVRRSAATALGRIRDRDSVPVLRQALAAETDENTKTRIAAALEKVVNQTEPDRLVAALKDDDASAQLRAALLLARRGDPRGLEWMDQTINGEDPELRDRTIRTLREIGGPAVVKILVARVGGSGYDGPTESVDALVDMGEPSIDPMVSALPKMKQNGRWIMLIGLARLGSPAMHAVTLILPDAPAELKKTMCQVLGGMGDREDVNPKPVEPLVAMLSDMDGGIRRSAANSLELLKWEPADAAQRAKYEQAKH